MDIEELVKEIVDAAFQVKKRLVPGFLESIYEKALIIELTERGLEVESQVPIEVDYKGHVIGEFKLDLLVENQVIVEVKAVNQLLSVHNLQLVNYLTTAHKDVGLLINFGEEQFVAKRKYRLYTPTKNK